MSPKLNKRHVKGNIMLFITAFIWGTAFVFQSLGMEYIGPFTFNCIRNIIAGFFLMPCIWFLNKINHTKTQKTTPQEKKTLIKGGVFCGIALFAASSFQQIGIMHTTVGKSGFITSLYVILVPIMGIFMKKKVSLKILISMVIAVTGLYLLCINETFTINRGDLYVFLCAVLFAVHILVIDFFSPQTDGIKMSCIQFFVCGIISIIPAMAENPAFTDIIRSMQSILYTGILSSGVAYTMQIVAQKDTEPIIASLLLSLESVFSALSGWLILGESMKSKEVFGCVLVFCAIILAQLPDIGVLINKRKNKNDSLYYNK